jgi:hypothetical protein
MALTARARESAHGEPPVERGTAVKYRRGGALLAFAILAALLGASAAPAGTSVASCASQVYETPFAPWLDPASYVLAPGGTLEDGAGGWGLSGGAAVTGGNEPFYVHAPGESHSLSLPGGATATSGWMCATLLHPDLRFLARNGGGPLSSLKVEVLFPNLFGGVSAVPFALVAAGPQWEPTLPYPFAVNALAAVSADGSIPIAFRFTASGGSWQIDDVYVDPYRSG